MKEYKVAVIAGQGIANPLGRYLLFYRMNGKINRADNKE